MLCNCFAAAADSRPPIAGQLSCRDPTMDRVGGDQLACQVEAAQQGPVPRGSRCRPRPRGGFPALSPRTSARRRRSPRQRIALHRAVKRAAQGPAVDGDHALASGALTIKKVANTGGKCRRTRHPEDTRQGRRNSAVANVGRAAGSLSLVQGSPASRVTMLMKLSVWGMLSFSFVGSCNGR